MSMQVSIVAVLAYILVPAGSPSHGTETSTHMQQPASIGIAYGFV